VEGYSSVLLFVRAAQRVSLHFALSAANRAEVARICQLVDGMPLGIELAAAWTHVLSCHEIAEEVARGLDFLETRQRDMPERHRSLRAVFDHSWKLLTEAEQRALSRLAIFRGGFSREAAEQVAGASLAIMESLVSKSLVQWTEAGRYDLHELIQQYATAQLDTDPVAGAAARQQHYALYLALAEAAGPHLKGARQLEWLKRLEEEHDNLRAALEWSLGGDRETPDGQSDLALRLAGALAWFWYMRSHFSGGRGWLLKALEHDTPGTTALRARALEGAGLLARRLGYHREAYSMAAEGAAIFRELGDKHGLAGALTVMGMALESLGDMRECRACYEEALALCREMGDPWSLARGLGNLGANELSFGNQAAGRALLEESVAILEESGDRFLIGRALTQLGELAYALGDYAAARAYMERSVSASREIGDPEGVSTALSGLGQVLWVQGDYVSAREVFEEAVTLCQTCCMDTVGLWSLAANDLAQGNLAAAREHIRAASALAEQAENKWQQVRARYFRGMLAYYEGDLGNAALLLEGGIAILRTFQDKIWLAQLLVTLGRTRSAQGETARAAVLFGESLDLYCKLGHKHGMATALEGLAGLASSENAERAAWLFGAAEAIRAAIGAPLPPVDRPAHERDVAAIRAQLAEAAFAAAWAEGRAMPLAQVVSLALQET